MIRLSRRWIATWAWAVLPALLAGCGPDPRPTVFVETPIGVQSGNVSISFTVKHRSSEAVDVDVIYTENGGKKWRPATVVDPANTTKGLSSSKGGEDHTLEWDSVADGVASVCAVDLARLRIIPFTSADEGRPGTTDDFSVNNGFGTAPSVTVVPTVGVQSGAIPIPYTITDLESDPATVAARYSTDGGASFAAATPAVWSDPTSNLVTSPTGEPYTFGWDSVEDIGYGLFTEVELRLTASDGIVPATCERPGSTGDFRIDNRTVVPRLYVTNPGTTALGVVDANTGALSSVGITASSPHSIAAVRHSGDDYLMVTDGGGSSVIVLDASDNTIVTEMPAQTSPRGIAVARVDDGSGALLWKAFVANSGSSSLTILDAESFNTLRTQYVTAIGSLPTGVAASSDVAPTSVYVTLGGDDAVAEIDASGGFLVGTIALDPRDGRAPGPIVSVDVPGGTYLYIGSTVSSSISVVDTSTASVLPSALLGVSFPDPADLAAFTAPSGRTMVLVSCSGDGSLRAVDVGAGHTLFATAPRVAQDPRGIVALRTPFGSRAYMADAAAGEIAQIDLDFLDSTGLAFPLPPITGLGTGILDLAPLR